MGTVKNLKFKAILYPFADYFCLAFFVFVLGVMFSMDSMRPAVYLLPVWLIIMGVTYKMSHKEVPIDDELLDEETSAKVSVK